MAIGKVGSYATTQAPQDNILQSMQYVDQLDYRAKQDRALVNEAKAKAEKAKEDAFAGDLAKINAKPTGKRGYDAPVIEAVSLLRNVMNKDYKDYKSGKINETDYNIKRNNTLAQVDLLKEKSNLVINNMKTIADMTKDNKLEYGFEEGALSLGKSIDNGWMVPELDENNNLVFIAYDEDENGNKTVVEKNGLAEFGNAKLNPTLKVDFQNEVEQFKKNNALGLEESISSNIKTGIKELKKGSNIDNNIKAFASARVQDPNFLRIAYRNATGETKYEITDPNDIKKAEDWVYQQIYDSYSKEVTKDEATQRGNLAIAQDKNRREAKKEAIQKTIAKYTAIKDEATGVRLNTKNENIIAFGEKQLPFKNLGGSKSGLNSGYITSFVLQDNGDIAVTGKALIDKGQKFKVGGKSVGLNDLFALSEDNTNPQIQQEAQAVLDSYNTAANYQDLVRIPSGSELGQLSAQAGYQSVDALKSELKKINNNPKQKIDY